LTTASGISIDFGKLGKEGFTIKTVDSRLVIVGGPELGTIYGVYGFLEKYLGCRWYAPDVNFVPQQKRDYSRFVEIILRLPALEYRYLYYFESFQPVFATQLHINEEGVCGNMWGHYLFSLLSADLYI